MNQVEIKVTISLSDLRYISEFEDHNNELHCMIEEKRRVIDVHEKNVAYLENQLTEKEKRIHELTDRVSELDTIVSTKDDAIQAFEEDIKERKKCLEKLCGIFGVPPHLIGDTAQANGWSTMEQTKHEMSDEIAKLKQRIAKYIEVIKRRERTIRKLRGK